MKPSTATDKTKNKNSHLGFVTQLGTPSLGLALSVTMLTTYLPSRLVSHASPITIGFIVGLEGVFGLFMPVITGPLADRSRTLAGRLWLILPAAGVCATSVAAAGFTSAVLLTAVVVGVFYIGYYSYLAPYWALYTDLIADDYSGRARSAEAVWRVTGSIAALILGGFLISAWEPLPFLLAAFVLIVVTAILLALLAPRRSRPVMRSGDKQHPVSSLLKVFRRNRDLRNLMFANACWNASLRSLQGFTVLFFTEGMGRSKSFASSIIFPVAAIGIVIMAPVAGAIADRWGQVRLLTLCSLIFAGGLALPAITQGSWVIFCIPVVSAAATAVMTLPEAMLIRITRKSDHGTAAGLFGLSRGAGSTVGPIVSGIAIVASRSLFTSTHGYAAFWLVAAVASLASIPALWALPRN